MHGDLVDPLKFLTKLIRLVNSNIQHELKPYHLASLITQKLAADHNWLFLFDTEHKHLQAQKFPNRYDIPPDALPLHGHFVARALTGTFWVTAYEQEIGRGLPQAWSDLWSGLASAVALPLKDDKTTYGVLVLASNRSMNISTEDRQLLETTSQLMALALKSGQLYSETKKRMADLNILSEMGQALSSTINIERLLEIITQITTRVLLAEGSLVNVLDHTGEVLLFCHSYGTIPVSYQLCEYQGRRLAEQDLAKLKHLSAYYGSIVDPDPPECAETETGNLILIPFLFQGAHSGSIILFNKKGSSQDHPRPGFDREDLELLLAMQGLISGALENALTFKRVQILARTNEQLVNHLSRLNEISSCMMSTVSLPGILFILTQALTLPQGLGFDRVVMLGFTKEQDEEYLIAEAYWESRWNNLDQVSGLSLSELLKYPSERAKMPPTTSDRARLLGLKVPLSRNIQDILVQSALNKQALRGAGGLSGSNMAQLPDFGQNTYALAPMTAKGELIGVIAVDREASGEPISSQDLRNLTTLSNQAGLALENARLYQDIEQANQNLSQAQGRLLETEKMAALGEMATGLAHEIRNPLVPIGGYASRLLKKMMPDDPLRKYAEVIMEEVTRLETVLNNVLNFSKSQNDTYQMEIKLDKLARETLKSLKNYLSDHHIEVKFTAEKNIPLVLGDDRQLTQVFSNLIYNSVQAMNKDGRLEINIFQTKRGDQLYVGCNIGDTGPGIDPQIIPNLFNPYFTTKDKGSGVGLSIVHRIVTHHHGTIQVINRPEDHPHLGAIFSVLLPAVAEAGLYMA